MQAKCVTWFEWIVIKRDMNSCTLFLCWSGSAPKNEFHAAFLADVKKSLGAEKSTQLFQAIHKYKKTDNYENLVTTVVSLFTERDEDFNLLVSKFFQTTTYICILLLNMNFLSVFTRPSYFFSLGFGMFIRPQHKKQYKEILDALIGQSATTTDVGAVSEDQQRQGEGQPNAL